MSPRSQTLFIFIFVLLLALPQAALLPLLDRDEPRFAEASREMLQSGHFIVPTFNHAPRYAKPPLIYWAQAACFAAFGGNAFSARLPSLLATAGTAALLVAWGAALGRVSLGTLAALAYALCLQTMQQGRVATADALLIFFTTLTGFIGWKMVVLATDKTSSPSAWNRSGALLALALAGGFLAKGPEAFLPAVALVIAARSGGARVLFSLAAIVLLALLLVSAWAIPAYVQTGGAYWREGLGHDVGDRMVSGFQGHGADSFGWYLFSLPLYFLLFWLSALPWSPLLVIYRGRLFRGWMPDAADRFLLLNAALFFGVFTFMVTKLPHYSLPAFPFLALLFARRWIDSGLRCEIPGRLMAGFGVAIALLTLILVRIFLPGDSNPSPIGTLVRDVGGYLPPETQFALVDFQEPSTIWEMRRVVRGFAEVIPDNPASLKTFLNEPGPRAIILTTGDWRRLSVTDRALAAPAKMGAFSTSGWNAAKGKTVALTLLVKMGSWSPPPLPPNFRPPLSHS
jgi:4-amino-4-deoxy-L-arabinose transferase-like glycosyltransferase